MSYHDWERRQGEIDSELTKNPLRQRWACLDSEDRIIACGIADGKFNMLCMSFTSLSVADWIEGGQKYCQVWTFKSVNYGMHINEVSHGRIRRSRAKLTAKSV